MKHFHPEIQINTTFPLTVTGTPRNTYTQTHTKLNVQFAAEVVNHFPLIPLQLTSRTSIAVSVFAAKPRLISACAYPSPLPEFLASSLLSLFHL